MGCLRCLWTGDFWRTFHSKWLSASGYYSQPPAIEVYGKDFKDEHSVMQIHAPVVKR
ncbi:MAG: hypothetical protein FWE21_08135 [Defluviitaleaceae bacterium]|nr:hypothetical protein [Defluviitaleaceae bacterium]